MNFVYPGFLYALAALLIPVIIHLFNLRRPKKVFFSNVDLLKEVELQTSKKLKVKHWLILGSRMLFVLFLVLIFAQPFIPGNDKKESKGVPAVSIYLDNSTSMSLPFSGDASIFEKSLKELTRLVDVFPRNARVQLMDNTFASKSMIFNGKEAAADQITEMRLSKKSRTANEIYQRQLKSLKQQDSGDKSIVWISDFQAPDFKNVPDLQLDTTIKHYFIPLVGEQIANIFIDSVKVNTPFVRPGEINQLHVWLRNSGHANKENVSLKLIRNNTQISTQNLDLEAESVKKIELDFSVQDIGKHQLLLSVDDNSVRYDNDFNFVLNVGETINILEIAETNDFNFKSIYKNEAAFRYDSNTVSNIEYESLLANQLIILNEIEQASEALKSSLRKFVQKGGHIAIIPSPKYPTIFNEFNIPNSKRADTSQLKIKVPKLDNMFFAGVVSKYEAKADMPKIRPVIQLSGIGTPILKTTNGAKFAVKYDFGKGRVYAFSSPFNQQFSTIYKHSWIVPLSYKMAMLSSNSNFKMFNQLGDNNVSVKYTAKSKGGILSLRKGETNIIPGQRKLESATLLELNQLELEEGFYEVLDQDSVVDVLAFNASKDESVLSYLTEDQINLNSTDLNVMKQQGEINFSDVFSEQNFGVALWKYCLALSLVFLAVETLLIRLL